MTRKIAQIVFRLALYAVTAMFPAYAAAQPSPARCATHDALKAFLEQRYKETPRAIGVIGTTGVLHLFLAETGSWTVTVTRPGGRSCIVAGGHSWEELPAPAKGDPA